MNPQVPLVFAAMPAIEVDRILKLVPLTFETVKILLLGTALAHSMNTMYEVELVNTAALVRVTAIELLLANVTLPRTA